MRRGQIVRLRAIHAEIVEFPGFVVQRHEFPLAGSHRAIALMLEKERPFGRIVTAAIELGNEVDARQRQRSPVVGAGGGNGRGQEVDDVGRVMHDAARLHPQARRPMHDAGRGDAAFVVEVLVHPPGRVGRVCPAGADAVKGARLAHLLQFFAGVEDVLVARFHVEAEGVPLKASAVVGGENDERIAEFAGVFEIGDDSAQLLIQPVDHRRVDGHAPRQIQASILWQAVPGRVDAGFGLAVILPGAARGELGGFRHDFQRFHPSEPFLAQFIPAAVVTPGVLRDLLLRRVKREVRRVVGQVEKPGFFRCFAGQLQEIQRVAGHRIGSVKFAVRVLPRLAVCRQAHQVIGIKKSLGADQRAVKLLEPVLGGIRRAKVPFSRDKRAVSGGGEHLRDGLGLIGNHAAIARLAQIVRRHVAQADAVRVLAGEDGRARRATAAGVVKLGQPRAVCSQGIQVGRLNFAAKATKVAEPQIVGHDEEQVRFFRAGQRSRKEGKEQDDGGGCCVHEFSLPRRQLRAFASGWRTGVKLRW